MAPLPFRACVAFLGLAVFAGCGEPAVAAGTSRRTTCLSGEGWTADAEPVSVPHTWNAEDACDGCDIDVKSGGESIPSGDYVRRNVTYRRLLPATGDRARVFLKCDGASQVAVVRVNGREIGRHCGAFTGFTFEITEALKRDGTDVLEIDVDNHYHPDIPPIHADFSLFGGLYRDVWLIETDAVCIDPTVDGACGVRVVPDAKTGEVTAHVRVSGGTNEVRRLYYRDFELWTPENPRLYTLNVRLDQGGSRDEVSVRFGFRTIELREDGLYLNGVRRKIRGVNRHQDKAHKGWALSRDDEAEDVALIKEIGADAVRTAHYPQSENFYSLCDEKGLLAWCEASAVDYVTTNGGYAANLVTEAREMVAQRGNHPSIVFWSLYNEMASPEEETLPIIRAEAETIRAADPSRLVTGVSDGPQAKKLAVNRLPDVLSFNLYPGWYGGEAGEIVSQLHEYLDLNGRAGGIVSEYGAGAQVDQHEYPVKPIVGWGPSHPEEYQAWLHMVQYGLLKDDPRCWGTFVWVMFDFASDVRKEGGIKGMNDKGLVTYDRKVRKSAFDFYKANWSADPVLSLLGGKGRTIAVGTNVVDVIAFSNVGASELFVNGASRGRAEPDDVRTCRWRDVLLSPGANEIRVTAGGREDRATWTVK